MQGESALRVDLFIPDELEDESFPLKRQTRAVASEAPAASTSCRGFHETADTASLACELNRVTSDIGTTDPCGASGMAGPAAFADRPEDDEDDDGRRDLTLHTCGASR